VTCGASPAAALQVFGFAMQGGTTTGGGNASPETVSSGGDLEDAVSSDSAKVVEFSGSLSGTLNVGSNTTLRGVGASATINGGISLDGVQNVILQNFRITGSGANGDAIGIQGSSHIWIDHLEIYDAEDGLLDITNGCDYITVSWTKFRYSGAGDHNFAVLIGSDDDDSGNYRITFHHNGWGNFAVERMPRVRFGDVHVFNNYYGTGTNTVLGNDHCIRAAHQSNVLAQSNYFDLVKTPHEVAEDNGSGIMTAPKCLNDTSVGSAAGCNIEHLSLNQDSNPSEQGTAFTPPYDQSAMEVADCVKANVMSGAGPH
jgi:pectate lyase